MWRACCASSNFSTKRDSLFPERASTCARKPSRTSRKRPFHFHRTRRRKFSIFGKGCAKFSACSRRGERDSRHTPREIPQPAEIRLFRNDAFGGSGTSFRRRLNPHPLLA